jgi:hypothetical protein
MGYTHYWYQSPAPAELHIWESLRQDVRHIVLIGAVPVRYESDSDEPVLIGDQEIRFNGVGYDGHETFLLERVPSEVRQRATGLLEAFSFCKTAMKPYDVIVCAVLIAARHHLGGLIRVSSDGGEDEWEAARQLCIGVGLEYAARFTLEEAGQ